MTGPTFRLTTRRIDEDQPGVFTGLTPDEAEAELRFVTRLIRQGANVSAWSLALEPVVERAGHTPWAALRRPQDGPATAALADPHSET